MKVAYEQRVARAVVGYSLAIFLFVAVCFLIVPGWFPVGAKLTLRNVSMIVVSIGFYTLASVYLLVRVIRDRKIMIETMMKPDQDPDKLQITYDEYAAADRYLRGLVEELAVLEAEAASKQRQIVEYKLMHRRLAEESDELAQNVQDKAELFNTHTNGLIHVMNKMDSLVWITDYEGVILYANNHLKEQIPNLQLHTTTLLDVLDATEEDIDLLRRRDFNSIIWKLKGAQGIREYHVSSRRYFEGNAINRLMFVAERYVEQDQATTFIRINKNLNFINEIGEMIRRETNTSEYIQRILEKIGVFCHLSALSIRVLDREHPEQLLHLANYKRREDYIDERPFRMEESHIGISFLEGRELVLNSLDDLIIRDDRIETMLNSGFRIGLFPLKVKQETIGVLGVVHDVDIDRELLLLINSVTINLTIALEKILLVDQLKINYFRTVEAFFAAFEMKVNYLHGHSRRVGRLVQYMADHLYLDQDVRDNLYISALLHDVGKLTFDESSWEPYFDRAYHGVLGRRMVEQVGFPQDVLDGIEFHHAPYLQDGEIQPLFAQFIGLANQFDKFYHIAPTEERAIKFLTELSEIEYSPQLRDVLLDMVHNHPDRLAEIYGEVTNGKV